MSDIFGSDHTKLVATAASGRGVIRFRQGNNEFELLSRAVQVLANENVAPTLLPAKPEPDGTTDPNEKARVLLIGEIGDPFPGVVNIESLVGTGLDEFLKTGAALEETTINGTTYPGMVDRYDKTSDGGDDNSLIIEMWNSSISGEVASLKQSVKLTLSRWKIVRFQVDNDFEAEDQIPLARIGSEDGGVEGIVIYALDVDMEQEDLSAVSVI